MHLALAIALSLLALTAHAGGSDAPVGDFDETDVLVISAENFDEKVLGSKYALVSSSRALMILTLFSISFPLLISFPLSEGRVLCTLVRSLQE